MSRFIEFDNYLVRVEDIDVVKFGLDEGSYFVMIFLKNKDNYYKQYSSYEEVILNKNRIFNALNSVPINQLLTGE